MLRKIPVVALFGVAILVSLPQAAEARSKTRQTGYEPGRFDYYALSLSWAPNYCKDHPDDEPECGTGKRYGFVLHGLWPQFDKGWPESCAPRSLTAAEKKKYAAIYPSPRLMEHEWAKHGTCSGLDPDGYFTLSHTLRESITLPGTYQMPDKPFRTSSETLARAFATSNPGLAADSVLPLCTGGEERYLSEIHICFDKTGAHTVACGDDERKRAIKSCGDGFLVRNVR